MENVAKPRKLRWWNKAARAAKTAALSGILSLPIFGMDLVNKSRAAEPPVFTNSPVQLNSHGNFTNQLLLADYTAISGEGTHPAWHFSPGQDAEYGMTNDLETLLFNNTNNVFATLNPLSGDLNFSSPPVGAACNVPYSLNLDVTDGIYTNTGTVQGSITNAAPDVPSYSFVVPKNGSNIFSYVVTDADTPIENVLFRIVRRPDNGVLSTNEYGQYIYTPFLGFTGLNYIRAAASDNSGCNNIRQGYVYFDVINDAPEFLCPTFFSLPETRSTNVDLSQCVSDPNGDPVSASISRNSQIGSGTLDGMVLGYNAPYLEDGIGKTDSMQIQITDGEATNTYSLSYDIYPVYPRTTNTFSFADKNGTVPVNFTAGDPRGLPLTFDILSLNSGSLVTNGNQIILQLPFGSTNLVELVYNASNGEFVSKPATNIYQPTNTAPFFTCTTSIRMPETSSTNIDLSGCTSDINGDPISGNIIQNAMFGAGNLEGFILGYTAPYLDNITEINDSIGINITDGEATNFYTFSYSIFPAVPRTTNSMEQVWKNSTAPVIFLAGDPRGLSLNYDVLSLNSGTLTTNGSQLSLQMPFGSTNLVELVYNASNGEFTSKPATNIYQPVNRVPTSDSYSVIIQKSTSLPLEFRVIDADGDPLTTTFTNSSGTIVTNGSLYTLVPQHGTTNPVVVTYWANDGMATSLPAEITVIPTNTPPIAIGTVDTFRANRPFRLDFDMDDLDPGEHLTPFFTNTQYTIVTNGQNIFLVPPPGATRIEIQFQADDGMAKSAFATNTYTLSGGAGLIGGNLADKVKGARYNMGDEPPIATSINMVVPPGEAIGPLEFLVSDPNGKLITTYFETPINCIGITNGGEYFILAPDGSTNAVEVPFTAFNGARYSLPATNTYSIGIVPPTAQGLAITGRKNAPIPLTFNGSTPYNVPLSVHYLPPSSGQIFSINGFEYLLPDYGFTGLIQVPFYVSDGNLESTLTTNTVTIGNRTPRFLYPTTISTMVNVPTTAALGFSDEDGDGVRAEVVQQPPHGYCTLDSSRNAITFTPTPEVFGTNSATIQYTDGTVTNTAEISIETSRGNNPPAFTSSSYERRFARFSPTTINVSAFDAEGSLVNYHFSPGQSGIYGTNNGLETLTLTNSGIVGRLHLNGNLELTASQLGNSSFLVDASDGRLTSTATVSANVTNIPPVLTPYTAFLDAGTQTEVLLGDEKDSEGDAMSYEVTPLDTPFATTSLSSNKLSVMPHGNYHGPLIYSVTGSDGIDSAGAVNYTFNVIGEDIAPRLTGIRREGGMDKISGEGQPMREHSLQYTTELGSTNSWKDVHGSKVYMPFSTNALEPFTISIPASTNQTIFYRGKSEQ